MFVMFFFFEISENLPIHQFQKVDQIFHHCKKLKKYWIIEKKIKNNTCFNNFYLILCLILFLYIFTTMVIESIRFIICRTFLEISL